MTFFQELFTNKIFLTAATGWFVAQILKTAIHLFLTRKFVAERLVGSGGMPSSHSATVCSLATAVYYEYGAGGFEFAIAVILAIIVMYDAMGVRRETGIQAKLLNDFMKLFESKGLKDFSSYDTLKEFVGHTPLQVLMGAILGIVLAVLIHQF
ncbi:MAG: divergent PAP2 family protein [Lachnospiraceae bacterium]|nr:divergent PAP2 family protein [Lachnospiraceae bacterium]